MLANIKMEPLTVRVYDLISRPAHVCSLYSKLYKGLVSQEASTVRMDSKMIVNFLYGIKFSYFPSIKETLAGVVYPSPTAGSYNVSC